MNMEEELKKKDNQDNKLVLKAKQSEMKNNIRELDFTKKLVLKLEKDLVNLDKEVELKKQINEVMLKNFERVADKANYAYETDPEYTKLLRMYQIVLNDRQFDEFELRREQLVNTIVKEKENIIESEKNIELLELEIKELEE